MRSRLKLHCKALATAAGFSGMVLALTFFFYDGPLRPPELISPAQATNEITNATLIAGSTVSPMDPTPPTPLEAERTTTVGLDHGLVHLQVLKTPLNLQQTTGQSGLEAFDYAANLYGQLALQMPHPSLASQLAELELKTQAMAEALRQATELRFEGPPTEDMSHLQVRAALANYVGQLNANSQLAIRYNHQGKVLEQKQSTATDGQALRSYQESLAALLHNPQAARYPQTMALIQQESNIMASLAHHLSLRWESTHYCPQECQPLSTSMRIYLYQSLPGETLATAPLPRHPQNPI